MISPHETARLNREAGRRTKLPAELREQLAAAAGVQRVPPFRGVLLHADRRANVHEDQPSAEGDERHHRARRTHAGRAEVHGDDGDVGCRRHRVARDDQHRTVGGGDDLHRQLAMGESAAILPSGADHDHRRSTPTGLLHDRLRAPVVEHLHRRLRIESVLRQLSPKLLGEHPAP